MKHLKRYMCIVLALLTLSIFSPDFYEFGNVLKAVAVDAGTDEIDDKFVPNFSFPDKMKAITVTAGKDFIKDPDQSPETTKAEIDSIIKTINDNELNSIILKTNYGDKALYSSTEKISAEEVAIKDLIAASKKNYLYVYVDLNINFILNKCEASALEDKINYLTHIAHKFSREYMADGIILDGYYSKKDVNQYSDYMENGSGIGFENWLLENGAYVFSLVSKAIHKSDNTIPVGISISNMWANKTTDEKGSNTKESFEALKSGYADTLDYLNKHYADFIMLDTKTSLTDPDVPLADAAAWWADVAKTDDIPFYVMHAYDKLGTQAAGWGMDDQVIRQIMAVEKLPKYSGCAFNSYTDFVNKKSATAVLLKYFNNQVDVDSLIKELTLNSPTKTNFTTYEPTVKFQGTFDKNFDIKLNGKTMELNEAGYFYYELPLEIGLNVFTLENKGKTITYRITRKIKVIQSVSPMNEMRVESGMEIAVSVVAYKGSAVTATFNGKTIALTDAGNVSEDIDSNSSYTTYVGTFMAPVGGKQDKSLGNIVFNANYQHKSYSTVTGAKIIVNRLPEGVLPTTLVTVTDPNNASVFYTSSTYGYAIPRSRLAKGTQDYLLKEVVYQEKKNNIVYNVPYYLTQSGRRIRKTAGSLSDGATFGENKIQFLQSYVQNYDTYLIFKVGRNVPVDVEYSPCNYYSGSKGNFYIQDFNATKIVVTFDYTVEALNDVALPAGGLFSSASWSEALDANGRLQKKLTLTLNKAGGYSGFEPSYTSDGTLTLRFNGHPSTLSGAVIAIDPGHGYTENGYDPGALGYVTERNVNLQVARLVEQKLIAQGATVHRLQTESQTYITEQRPNVARQWKPDIFLSIHSNSALTNTATGSEAWYFYPFSKPLAKYLSENVASALGTNNRGNIYNEFLVTLQQEFASCLVELGFVSNETEGLKLGNPSYQNAIADAIVRSMSQYLANN